MQGVANMEKPNKKQFEAYVSVQESGVTNMWEKDTVIYYAAEWCDVELSKENILYIFKNYSELAEEYK